MPPFFQISAANADRSEKYPPQSGRQRIPAAKGVALDQLVNSALAEKLSAMRTESFFRERAARADIPRAIEILKKAGAGSSAVAFVIEAEVGASHRASPGFFLSMVVRMTPIREREKRFD